MAAVGLFAGVFSLLIYLCIILVPVALLVVLQVWLCKKEYPLRFNFAWCVFGNVTYTGFWCDCL